MLAAAREVRAALNGEKLAGLVNNAGIAVSGPLLGLSADEFRRQMEVNVIGPVIATQAFSPLLGADASLKGPPGRIVMISSVAGKNGNPLSSAYVASKHAIEGLSESLRRELMCPASTSSWRPTGENTDLEQGRRPISPLQNSLYLPALQGLRFMQQLETSGLPAEQVAERIFDALTLPSPKVRYHIAPASMRYLMAAVLPKRVMDRVIAKRLGLMPPPA